MNSKLSTLKGTHVVVQASDYLLEKYQDLYMVYAGIDQGLVFKDGNVVSIEEIIRRQNRKYVGRVIYLGKLKQEQLFPIVKHALACVLPSRIDNLPNSCIEAMSLGCIVIGTYGASFEQLIRNKESGLLIKRDSFKSLIRAVEYLMEMGEESRNEMRKKAVESIERLSAENVYEKTMQCYKKVINRFEGSSYES
jgi:glycosyltransferase involved in cell wall biosynthesis